jgi:hypothetical protein
MKKEAREDDPTDLIDLVCDTCATVLLERLLVRIPEWKRAKVSI